MSANQDPDPALRKSLVTGFFSPSVYLPLGLTLEALHAMKVQVYFGSAMRRELWTLAHTRAQAEPGRASRALIGTPATR